jgi:aspartate beta-hydroxylase
MEEVPQHRIIARHVAALAIATNSCRWSDPYQRPGYMARFGLSNIPYTPPENHPSWCRVFEKNWIRILHEYNQLNSTPSNFSNVGSGQRGSGHDDHLVVSGRSWKEYVLFGTGSKGNDSDAPFTKQLLRSNVPDAVALAEEGGGEVIFSCLSPRTHIKPHCGPTNLRWTAHLALVIPDSASDCQIRVRRDWHSWQAGKVLLFDDSYEHEVRNDTDEARVVLLIRLWHPQLAHMSSFQRESILAEAMARKEEEVRKRYHPPS